MPGTELGHPFSNASAKKGLVVCALKAGRRRPGKLESFGDGVEDKHIPQGTSVSSRSCFSSHAGTPDHWKGAFTLFNML